MAAYYVVQKNGKGGADISTNNDHAKQAIWGWAGDYGSTKDPGAIELYGRKVNPRRRWLWSLSPAGVTSLLSSLRLYLREPQKYADSKSEIAASKELLRKLEAL